MYILHLFKKKWSFKKNKKVDLLILDYEFLGINLQNIDYAIYDNNAINLRYLFVILFYFILSKKKKNFSLLRETYFKTIISSYNPKIILGKDRYGLIGECKKYFPNKTSIFYEWGYTFDDQILMAQYVIQGYPASFAWQKNFGKKYKSPKNFSHITAPDYYLVFDQRSLNFISKVFISWCTIKNTMNTIDTF